MTADPSTSSCNYQARHFLQSTNSCDVTHHHFLVICMLCALRVALRVVVPLQWTAVVRKQEPYASLQQCRPASSDRGATQSRRRPSLNRIGQQQQQQQQQLKEIEHALSTAVETKQWESAVLAWHQLRQRHSSISGPDYISAITAFNALGQHRQAFEAFKTGSSVHPYDRLLYKSISHHLPVETAVQLLAEKRVPSVNDFTLAMYTCGREGDWRTALKLLQQLRTLYKSHADVRIVGFAIHACCKGGQLDEALSLYEDLLLRSAVPPVATFCALLDACSEAQRYQKTLELLRSMRKLGVRPDVRHYTRAVHACSKADQLQLALDTLHEMILHGIGE
jgi:pentatricopeptide repeat protein